MKSHSRGFTLLEVLVALIVLSIGLLGLSGLQATSLSGNHQALIRSQATLMVSDIIDRMRANRASALAGDYDIAIGDSTPNGPACSTPATPCTGAQVADRDLETWRNRLAPLLPGNEETSIAVTTDSNGSVAVVTVRWADPKTGGLTAPLVTRARL
jgi:type IV pilus assembly protein PilV